MQPTFIRHAATPPAVPARLSAEVIRSPAEFSAFFERERSQWAGTLAQSGVKID